MWDQSALIRAAQIAASDKCLRWESLSVILNVLMMLSIGYYMKIIKNVVMWQNGEKS